ncbi:hypothetical protein V8F44DRAFT_73645 [Aspergillus fumigatus]
MPEKLPSQQTPGRGQLRKGQTGSTSPPRNEDSGSGAEGPARRRLHKHASTPFLSDTPPSSKTTTGSRISIMAKRRLSIRDQKVPQGPRPQESSRRRYGLKISNSLCDLF